METLLLISVFVIATCGLVYELIAGTMASYLLGDSVTQFSTVIGSYLFAMGIGAWLSKHISRNLVAVFIQVELLIGLFGGASAILLFAAFEHVASFRLLLYTVVTIIGVLVGLEIPLLMRILKDRFEFKDLVSRIFTFDYVGALVASLLFPLILVPRLGLVQSALLFGILNILVALLTLHLFSREIPWVRLMRGTAFGLLIAMTLAFAYSERLVSFSESSVYPDPILYARSSPYQRIVLTKSEHDLRLYLNGNLQFSSRDEYRYHEGLVHPGLAAVHNPRDVLVLGGGDGLALREILKYPSVQTITLVDLDAEMTRLFSTQPVLTQLNGGSLSSPKVKIISQDAFIWLRNNRRHFDFIAADFPDPSNYSIGKLYTTSFFRLVHDALAPDGVFVVQCTSPLIARKSFWCINRTLQEERFFTAPYHVYVPSFGEWGFIIGTTHPYMQPEQFPSGLRFMSLDTAQNIFHFPDDMKMVETEVNRLTNQALVRYFESEWGGYAH